MIRRILRYVGLAAFFVAGFFVFHSAHAAAGSINITGNTLGTYTYSFTITGQNVDGAAIPAKVMTVTVNVVSGAPGTPPTATLTGTANGVTNHNITVPTGTAFTYNWTTSGGTSFATTLIAISKNGVLQSADGCGTPVNADMSSLVGGLTSGSAGFSASNCQAGYAYSIRYSVTNAAGTTSDILNITVPGSVIGPGTPPTALLTGTANGVTSGNVTVSTGTQLTYNWNTDGTGTSYATTLIAISKNGVSQSSDACGNATGADMSSFVGGLNSGSASFVVPGCQEGYSYSVRYSVTNSAGTASSILNIAVNGPPAGPPPPGVPTAVLTGTANGITSHNITVSTGTSMVYNWATSGGVSYVTTLIAISKNGVAQSVDGCGTPVNADMSGAVGGITSGSSAPNTVANCQAGYAYSFRYSVTNGAGTTSDVLNITVPGSVAGPGTSPTAILMGTANGVTSHSLTVSTGTSLVYNWTTSGGTSYTTTLIGISKNGVVQLADGCGTPTGADLSSVVGGLTSGNSAPFAVANCQAGYVYSFRYSVTNSAGTTSDIFNITVPGPTAGPGTLPTATLTGTVNGISGTTVTAPTGTSFMFNWTTSGGTSYATTIIGITKNGVAVASDPCPNTTGDDRSSVVGGITNGSYTQIVPACEAGYTYTIRYSVTNAAGTTSANLVIIVPGPTSLPPSTVGGVSVSCAPTVVGLNGVSNCSATVNGTNGPSQAVTWDVASGGGSVTAGGTYTAPAAAGTAVIRATSVQDPSFSGTASVTVTAGSVNSVSLSIAPGPYTNTVPVSITAIVGGTETGNINYSFWWDCPDSTLSVAQATTGCGDPNSAGYGFKADNQAATTYNVNHVFGAAGNYTIKVIIERGSSAPAEARISIFVSGSGVSTVTGVTANCAPGSVTFGGTSNCSATVNGTNSPSQAVTWSIASGGGSVNGSGVFTAPGVSGTTVIRATSVQNSAFSGTASVVTAAPVGLSISPSSNTPVGSPVTVTASGGTAPYTWSISGATSATASGPGNNTVLLTYDTPGSYLVTVIDASGSIASITVTVFAPTCTFSGSPSRIVVPGFSNLTWGCANAVSCTISSVGAVNPLGGTVKVTPAATTAYVLSCTGSGSGVNNSFVLTTTVNVVGPGVQETNP